MLTAKISQASNPFSLFEPLVIFAVIIIDENRIIIRDKHANRPIDVPRKHDRLNSFHSGNSSIPLYPSIA